MPVPLARTVTFSNRWQAGQITDLLKGTLCCDLILTNHIIDDLLFSFYLSSPQKRRDIYSDPDLSKLTWDSMSRSDSFPRLQKQVVEIFLELARHMPLASVLVLRHYPSTFALMSRDVVRVNIELDTYFRIAKAAQYSVDVTCCFFDLSAVNVPIGSKYPNSVLLMRRKPTVSG